jgi:hypothetical protein
MPDSIVILRCSKKHKATKIHTLNGTDWETESYNAGKWFEPYVRSVEDILQLGRLIHRASLDDRALIVRAGLKTTPEKGQLIRRQYLPDDSALIDVDRQWLAIDLDSAPAPKWLDHHDPKNLNDVVRWSVLQYLPPIFFGVACYYRWSASAGVKPWDELRLQLWYWCDRKVSNASLKNWLRDTPYIDVSLFCAAQIHFIARPVFINAPDPMGDHRDGMLHGPPHVVLPNCVVDLKTYQRRIQERAAKPKPAVKGDHHTAFVRGCVRRAIQNIRDATEGNRHRTIFAAAAWLGKLVGGGLLDETTAVVELEREMKAKLPAKRHKIELRAIHDGIERGKKTPFDFSA